MSLPPLADPPYSADEGGGGGPMADDGAESGWYYLDDAKPVGPMDWVELARHRQRRTVTSATLVWRDGMPDWQSLAEVERTNNPAGTPPPLPPGRTSSPGVLSPLLAPAPGANRLGWAAAPAYPWRRYGARMLDSTVNGTIGFMLVGFALGLLSPSTADWLFSQLEGSTGRLVDAAMTVAIAGLVGGVIIGATGTSLGKAIFGLKVLRNDLKTLGIGRGLLREGRVWVLGLGCGLPIITLLTMLIAFRWVQDNGTTVWDKDRYTVLYRPAGRLQNLMNLAGIGLMVGSLVFLRYLAAQT